MTANDLLGCGRTKIICTYTDKILRNAFSIHKAANDITFMIYCDKLVHDVTRWHYNAQNSEVSSPAPPVGKGEEMAAISG